MDELIIGFSKDADAKVLGKANTIHTALTTDPAKGYFTGLAATMVTFKTGIDGFQGTLALDSTPANAALRKEKRDALILQMKKLAATLELTADGNLVWLAATGFDLKTKPTRSTGPLSAPENLRMSTTGIAGEARGKCKAVPLADSYECAWTLDPLNGPWTAMPAVSNSQNMLFTGLSRGKDYYFRVRAIGANGPSGWSDVATMMVV